MQKKYKIIVFTIVSIFFIVMSYLVVLNEKIKYRSSFEIKISGNYSSSGASREYNANIKYKKGVAVSGTQVSQIWEGGGCQTNCNRQTSCKVLNQKWVDSTNGEECTLGHDNYLTKEGLIFQIEEHKLVPINDCSHLDTCYEIL